MYELSNLYQPHRVLCEKHLSHKDCNLHYISISAHFRIITYCIDDMKPYYLLNSRIATHIVFWLAYYALFGYIWANDGNYLASYFLEFVLLPIRMLAVYVTIYFLIPRYLSNSKPILFLIAYVVLLVAAGLLQRLFTHFFYEGLFVTDSLEIFSWSALMRSVILINSTVIFVSAIKIAQLWLIEKEKNKKLLMQQDNLNKIVEIKAEKRIYRVMSGEILYIEGLGNYVTFVLENQKIISYSSLKDVEKLLPSHFARIHKSYIINKDHIKSYNHEDVEIAKQLIPIGRSYKNEIAI